MVYDFVFVGGGLSTALAVLALQCRKPDASIAVIERQSTLGGNHTWCFHARDVPHTAAAWLEPLVVRRWPAYRVLFPRRARLVSSPYACVTSARLHQVLTQRAAGRQLSLRLGAHALEVGAHAVSLEDGSLVQGTLVIDARGPNLEHPSIFDGPALPDDFSLYLHAPTRTDPSLAPPGCEAFYVLSPVPHLGSADLDWDQIAPMYAERILTALERTLPDLRKHVVVKRWLTPKGFQSELRSYQGSAFSCAPTLTQSAWFRPHNRDPEIEGLYLVGAGTHPGAGLPGVVNSAKATARVIMQDFPCST